MHTEEQWNKLCDIIVEIKSIETLYPHFEEDTRVDQYTGQPLSWHNPMDVYVRYLNLIEAKAELIHTPPPEDVPF